MSVLYNILSEMLHDPLCSYYISALLVLVPVIRIFQRARLPGALAAALLVPMAGHIICAGLLALKKWPLVAGGEGK